MGSLHFLYDHQPFRAILIHNSERSATVTTQRGVAELDSSFDVLWVMIGATDDDQVLDPASDEQRTGLIENPRFSGAQPFLVWFIGEPRIEAVLAGLPVLPIAARDIRAADPDLADAAWADPVARSRGLASTASKLQPKRRPGARWKSSPKFVLITASVVALIAVPLPRSRAVRRSIDASDS